MYVHVQCGVWDAVVMCAWLTVMCESRNEDLYSGLRQLIILCLLGIHHICTVPGDSWPSGLTED